MNTPEQEHEVWKVGDFCYHHDSQIHREKGYESIPGRVISTAGISKKDNSKSEGILRILMLSGERIQIDFSKGEQRWLSSCTPESFNDWANEEASARQEEVGYNLKLLTSSSIRLAQFKETLEDLQFTLLPRDPQKISPLKNQ